MAVGVERRQVFDLPKPLIEVTEHRGLVYPCAGCGGGTRAPFPTGRSDRPNTASESGPMGVYLHTQQLIPEDRTAEALTDLFGAPGLCAASVAQWTQPRAAALAPVVERIKALICVSRVCCLDETGLRVAGGRGSPRQERNGAFARRLPGLPSPLLGSDARGDGFPSQPPRLKRAGPRSGPTKKERETTCCSACTGSKSTRKRRTSSLN